MFSCFFATWWAWSYILRAFSWHRKTPTYNHLLYQVKKYVSRSFVFETITIYPNQTNPDKSLHWYLGWYCWWLRNSGRDSSYQLVCAGFLPWTLVGYVSFVNHIDKLGTPPNDKWPIHMCNINSARVFGLVNSRHLCIGKEWFQEISDIQMSEKRPNCLRLKGCLMLIWVVVSNIFFYVHPENWGRFPFWLIFFKWVETTN